MHILIIVENLPVVIDRRVWLECRTLLRAGYEVSVICPKEYPTSQEYELVDGVHVYSYRAPPQARGALGFAREFLCCWVRTALLSLRVWKRSPFQAIQACNPPDTYWALARLWRLRGVRFVFDHHDLNPELFRSRFGEPTSLKSRLLLLGLHWLERRTFGTADHVISSNDEYRRIAIQRGGRSLEDTSVVRSGPDTNLMGPVVAEPTAAPLRPAYGYLLAYLGIMGPQDNVDQLVEVMDVIVNQRGRHDVHLVLMGFGDCLEELKREVSDRQLDSHITFTGRVGPAEIADWMSEADLGLGPDLCTPLNDVSTMNKTMEYMAFCLPSVSFDLAEVRRLVGDTGVLVPSGDVEGYTDAVLALLDDGDRRVAMGIAARERVVSRWDWYPQSLAYLKVYEGLIGVTRTEALVHLQPAGLGAIVERQVDLRERGDLETYVRSRVLDEPIGKAG